MATRTGSAVWEGTLKEGRGTMKLGSGAFDGPYSFSSRFESGKGTNPEELIGAAEAGPAIIGAASMTVIRRALRPISSANSSVCASPA